MANESAVTREKILKATIDIVGMKGEVTIREITEKAGVNVASINYYFGNKDNLLKEVENYYAEKLFNSGRDILKGDGCDLKEKLFKWSVNLVEFMFKYPALVTLIVRLTSEDISYNPVLIKKIYLNGDMQESVINIIEKITDIHDRKILNFKYIQLFSGILGTVINRIVTSIYGSGKNYMNIDNPEELRQYMNLLISSIVN